MGLTCTAAAIWDSVAGAGLGLALRDTVRFMLAEDLLSLEQGTGY